MRGSERGHGPECTVRARRAGRQRGPSLFTPFAISTAALITRPPARTHQSSAHPQRRAVDPQGLDQSGPADAVIVKRASGE
ncbi:hypothetical protein FM106_15520 [Brachybacterium faecium]|nr:hypothetical protein FM106_15520 [Brachybacterium faecium]